MNVSNICGAAITIIIAVALAYVLEIATREAQGEAVPPLLHSAYDERLDQLDREAIETAYRDHVTQLFLSWMKDATKQPERAQIGHRKARKAYIDIMAGIDVRK